ncbi:MAG: DUF2339 domain-containing protein [Planctomycetes bacterium]|nr:DUF2339 domain-containing protein [Planctomycetota bacterium]
MWLVWCALAFIVVVPIAALLLARAAWDELRIERQRVNALAARLAKLEAAAAARETPAPAPPAPIAPIAAVAAPPPPELEPAPAPASSIDFVELSDNVPAPARAAAPAASPARTSSPHVLPNPRRRPRTGEGSLEHAIGARAYVWVGGIALALAGSFFVKYAVDHWEFGPALRCTLATLFGLALIAIAERFRKSSENIAQSLSGAGVAVLYAALYAAASLYRLIDPLVGLLLLAAITGGAVALSFRHGVAVAVLGMIGGYAMPALLGPHELPVELRFTYLAALHCGLCFTSTRGRRRALGAISLGASAVWAIFELQPTRGVFSPDTFVLFVTVIASASSAFGLSAARNDPSSDATELPIETFLGSALASFLVAVALERADYPPHLWWSTAAIGIGGMLLGRRLAAATPIPWMTAAAGAFSAALFALDRKGDSAVRWIVLGGALLHGVGGSLASFGARRPRDLAWIAACSTAAFLGIAWWTDAPAVPWLPWWAVVLLFGAAHAAFARARLLRRAEPLARAAAVPHVVAAAASLGAAAAMAFDDEPVAVAFALLAPLLVAAARRLDLAELHHVAAVAAAIGFLRTLLWDNPAARLVRGDAPHWPWVGATVGVPIAAFVAAALLLRDDEARHPKRRYVLAASRLAVLLVGLLCRYGTDGDDLATFDATGAGVLTAAWLALAIGFAEFVRRAPALMPRVAGLGTALLALGALLFALQAGASPFDPHAGLGDTPIANPLLLQYALPALLLWILAHRWRASGQESAAVGAAAAATLIGWWWATVTTRHAFVGAPLGDAFPAGRELYAYSVVWIAYAVALLVAAVRVRSRAIRAASAVVMLAAVLKVFLVDAADLRDLWRVASFLGLGIVLIVLARVYQRIDLGRDEPDAPTAPD